VPCAPAAARLCPVASYYRGGRRERAITWIWSHHLVTPALGPTRVGGFTRTDDRAVALGPARAGAPSLYRSGVPADPRAEEVAEAAAEPARIRPR
jgi:hypothetical protein